jgi:precorrin-3B methylase
MSQDQIDHDEYDNAKGKLLLVGLGPGDVKHITPAAVEALNEADVVIGFKAYLSQVKELVDETRLQEFPMGKEQERALEALRRRRCRNIRHGCAVIRDAC